MKKIKLFMYLTLILLSFHHLYSEDCIKCNFEDGPANALYEVTKPIQNILDSSKRLESVGYISLTKANPLETSCDKTSAKIDTNVHFIFTPGVTTLEKVASIFSNPTLLNQTHEAFEKDQDARAKIRITQLGPSSDYDIYSQTAINLYVYTSTRENKIDCKDTKSGNKWNRSCVVDIKYKDTSKVFDYSDFHMNCIQDSESKTVDCNYIQHTSMKSYCSFIFNKLAMDLALNASTRTLRIQAALANYIALPTVPNVTKSYAEFKKSKLEKSINKFFISNEPTINSKSVLEQKFVE